MPILSLRDKVQILPPENIEELQGEEIQGEGYEIWKEIFKELTGYNIQVYITNKYIKYRLILKLNGEEIEGDTYPDVCYGDPPRDGKNIKIYIYSKDSKFLEKAFNLIKLNNNEIKLLIDLFAELVHAGDDKERIRDVIKQFVSDYPQYYKKLAKNDKLKVFLGEEPISIVIIPLPESGQLETLKSVEIKSKQDIKSKPISKEKVSLESDQIKADQESEEKRHEKWKLECRPDRVNIEEISPKYVKPSEKKISNNQREQKISFEVISTSSIPESSRATAGQTEILDDTDRKAIGRWGEEFVFCYLKERYKEKYKDKKHIKIEESNDKLILRHNNHILIEVYWLNYEEDQMREYDIKVIENGKEKYIEVKSTSGSEKDYFDISLNQLVFAMKHSDNYYIYRVYKAGTKEPELVIFENPYKLYQEGKLKIEIKSLRIYI